MVIINHTLSFEQSNWLRDHIGNCELWVDSYFCDNIDPKQVEKYKWRYDPEHIYFQNEEDALWFKFVWL